MTCAPPARTRFRCPAVLAVVVLLFAAGCARTTDVKVPVALAQRCVVLAMEPDPGGWSAWFQLHMPDARVFPVGDADAAVTHCLGSDLVLIAPGAGTAATNGALHNALERLLAGGGRLLTCGVAGRTPYDSATGFYTATGELLRIQGVAEPLPLKAWPVRCPDTDHLPPGPGRIIRVLDIVRLDGSVQGRAGHVILSPTEGDRFSVHGWIGFDAGPHDEPDLAPAVTGMIDQLTRALYLHQFGADRRSAASEAPLQASVNWIDRRPQDLSPIRIAAEWITSRGLPIKRIVSPPVDPLVMPATLNLGLAPETSGKAESYTLRFSIRDRNDQETLDSADQSFKVFPPLAVAAPSDFVSINAGQLVHRRRPVFMLGVNYWPSPSARLAAEGRHWLDARLFSPETVTADLDLMVAVGINAVAMEYTDIGQAPQVLYVLDELRARGMWACLYVPALHPMDLRLDDGMRMLEALGLDRWPEVFAIEIARSLPVKPRVEMRRLDPEWADWISEHFNSPIEAEQKLGLTLWRERGRLSGPPDSLVRKGPHQDRGVALYYAFLRDYTSRRFGLVRRMFVDRGYSTLITARSAYGWPDGPPADTLDGLDLSTGAMHQDFLFPDAWAIHPLRSMYHDGGLLAAYARGVGAGKPVLWSEYGQAVGTAPDHASLLRQKEVYKNFLDQFIAQGSYGAFAWWYPPGRADAEGKDWGLVSPGGTWRPVEEVFRGAKYQLRQLRPQIRAPVRQSAPLIRSMRHWRDLQNGRSGLFAKAVSADVSEWTLPGTGVDSESLLQPAATPHWSELDAFVLLNGEWGFVTVDEKRQIRLPGEKISVYLGAPLTAEILNSGTITWKAAPTRKPGSIWVRISQPGNADVWIAAKPTRPGETISIQWAPRETGLWELQPYLIGYEKFGERLLVEVTTPPRRY